MIILFMGQIFSEDINTDSVPFPESVLIKAFGKNCFYIDVSGEKKITHFHQCSLTVRMNGEAREHFDS